MASSPITAWQIERGEKVEVVAGFLFLGSKITADGDCSHEIRRQLLLGRKAMTNLDSILRSRDTTLPTKVHIVRAMVFPVFHVWFWELDCKEGRTPKNWCLQTVVLEKTLGSSLASKEMKSVNLKGNQPWILTGRTDAEAPLVWSSDANSRFMASEDEMTGWLHWWNGHELGQASGDGDRQSGMVCCSPWGHEESDMTGWLDNNSHINHVLHIISFNIHRSPTK